MGEPSSGRLHGQQQSWAGPGVGRWEGLELSPLWGTAGAGQRGSPPCLAMKKGFPHLLAFVDKHFLEVTQAQTFPREAPGQGRAKFSSPRHLLNH